MLVDLRSDTVTKPTLAMKAAMFEAEVGDDVFDEDPSVKALESKIAEIFGMEAALYCPSGTMTNQIAIRISTQPQDEIICDRRSHIYLYEGGGPAYNSMVSVKLLDGNRGRLDASQVMDAINPDDIHFPRTSLISLENTMNKGGGCCYHMSDMREIKAVAEKFGLRMHLDGARLFNAIIASNDDPAEYGEVFDTLSVCFSKGLGAPVGSAVLGSAEDIRRAKRVRKVFGGGMRQAGYLAAACTYALDNHVTRLTQDHERARILGQILQDHPLVQEVMPVETNIVIAKLDERITPDEMLEKLKEQDILAVPFGKHEIRLVTHLEIDDDMLNYFADAVKKISL